MNLPAPTAEDIGRLVARRVFNERGNHSEAHLTEVELAKWLTIAASLALTNCQRIP